MMTRFNISAHKKTIFLCAAAVVLFIVSAIAYGFFGAISLVSILALLFFSVLGIKEELFTQNKEIRLNTNDAHPYDYAFIAVYILLLRVITYVFAYLAARATGVVSDDFFTSFERTWLNCGTDANSYLGIAKNWYVTQGDPMYHIVFFPLYPILIKFFELFLGNYLIAALTVNLCASFGIGIMAYKLALLDFDRKCALRFVRYIFILPAAFFYAAPMTESLFVFLCLLCIYFARKYNFLLCAVFGALASFTRSHGILLMLPCAYIALADYIHSRKNSTDKKNANARLIKRAACVACISIGFLLYLHINYTVWGNPMQFSIFQREHWGQQLGFFPNTVKTIWTQLYDYCTAACGTVFFENYNMRFSLALWLPELIYIIASPIIMLLAARKLRPEYTLYFIAYFVFSIGATWLLSAPRYLMACISLPLAIAVLTKNRIADYSVTALCIVLSSAYLFMYAASSPIY